MSMGFNFISCTSYSKNHLPRRMLSTEKSVAMPAGKYYLAGSGHYPRGNGLYSELKINIW